MVCEGSVKAVAACCCGMAIGCGGSDKAAVGAHGSCGKFAIGVCPVGVLVGDSIVKDVMVFEVGLWTAATEIGADVVGFCVNVCPWVAARVGSPW